MADAMKPSDAAGSGAGVDAAAGSADVNWAAAAAARVSGRAANEANAASARPSARGPKAARRRRYKPACVSSGALTVLTGIGHCAVGLCIPQFRVSLRTLLGTLNTRAGVWYCALCCHRWHGAPRSPLPAGEADTVGTHCMQDVLTGMWNRGRRTGAAFEFTGEHDLMLSFCKV